MWENGSCKLKSSKAGMAAVVKAKAIRESCFAMELRGLARHLSGNEDYSWGGRGGGQY